MTKIGSKKIIPFFNYKKNWILFIKNENYESEY